MRLALFAGCAAAVLLAIAVGLVIGTREVMEATENELPAEPVPYLTDLGEHAADAIAVTAPCALCDLGLGHCRCTVRCVADACEGRSTLATWTEGDFEWAAAQGFSLEERSELQ